MAKVFFNSFAERENYRLIKDEAYNKGITVRQHISNIINIYAENLKRKEVKPRK
jgi:hypothetical protein